MRMAVGQKRGNTAILVVDMYEQGNLPKNKFAKWLWERTDPAERVATRICKTVRLGKRLSMETLVITYLRDDAHDRILEAAGNPKPVKKPKHDAFEGTDIKQRLEEQNVENVIVCGYHRSLCVLETARGAAAAGFKVIATDRLMHGEDIFRTAKQIKEVAEVFATVFGLHRLMRKLSET